MEAGTVTKGRTDQPGADDTAPLKGHEAVAKAATSPGQMSEEERASALAWFLEDDADSEPLTHTFSINVAGPDEEERLVDWTIRSLDMDTIDGIRTRARASSRAQRRAGATGGDVNEMKAALGMVAAATVVPDLDEVRRAKNAVNREEVLQHRFRAKPGLILQISGKVLELSGYDEEDVREAVAAKNS